MSSVPTTRNFSKGSWDWGSCRNPPQRAELQREAEAWGGATLTTSSQKSACLETVVLSHMYKPLLSTAMYLCFILTGCQQLSLTNTTVSKQVLGGLEVLVNASSSTPISTILQVPVSPRGLRRGTAYNCGGAVLRQAGSPAKSNRDVTGNTSGSSQGHSSGGRSLWHRPGYEEWPPCVLQVNHTQTWLLLSSVHSCLNPLGRDGSA